MARSPQNDLPRLGRYQVLSKLAQGGMAEIFLAKAIGVMGFERLVAIKLIHSHLTRDTEFVKMFIDEARIAMHLHHRNIVQTFDLDKADDTYFIAMEFVHGVNLYDVYERIAARGQWFELPLALYVIAEACKGLHFAHTRFGPDGRPLGIVHRDISPQNILLSFEGEVKITDFGIAKAAERMHHTTPGIVKGKYAYMAPEVLRDSPADPRVDVFAAGVVLYELLVGENPFAGSSAVETIENVLNVEVPSPTSKGAPGGKDLDHIVAKALAKDPDRRYQSALELAQALTDHGLNLTMARRDIAAGDAAVQRLLSDLFPDKANRLPGATAEPVQIPLGGTGSTTDAELAKALPNDYASAKTHNLPALEEEDEDDIDEPARGSEADRTLLQMPSVSVNDLPAMAPRDLEEVDVEASTAMEIGGGAPTVESPVVSDAMIAAYARGQAATQDESALSPEDRTIMSGGIYAQLGLDADETAQAAPDLPGAMRLPTSALQAVSPPRRPRNAAEEALANAATRRATPSLDADGNLDPTLDPLPVTPVMPRGGNPMSHIDMLGPASSGVDMVVPVASAGRSPEPFRPNGAGPALPASSGLFGPPPHMGGPRGPSAYGHPTLPPVMPPTVPVAPAASRRTTLIAAVLVLIAVAIVGVTVVVRRSSRVDASVTIPITSDPSGASVSINGTVQPDPTPLNATVPAGRSYRIEISKPGHAPAMREIRPVVGMQSGIHVVLERQ
jgi:serine/threonine protein kinase